MPRKIVILSRWLESNFFKPTNGPVTGSGWAFDKLRFRPSVSRAGDTSEHHGGKLASALKGPKLLTPETPLPQSPAGLFGGAFSFGFRQQGTQD